LSRSYFRPLIDLFRAGLLMNNNDEEVLDAIAAVQDGDLEVVKSSLSQRLVTVNARDRDGCTLLHWAAINNRTRIAKLLIEFGAEHVPGGVLRETPLQWALRKRYYEMVSLLVEKLHADLREKSSLGIDALHLACRLGKHRND
jgi:palmitoyltransferase ZDHHC13/17